MEVANLVYFLILITFAPLGEHYQQEQLFVKKSFHNEQKCTEHLQHQNKERDPRTEKWGCLGVPHPMMDVEHEQHQREGSGGQQHGTGVGPQ